MVAAAVLSSSAASADPVRIVTSGGVDAHEGNSGFGLVGDGFLFGGEVPSLSGPLGDCVFSLCRPGDVVNLSAHATPHLSLSDATTAVFEGRTYENVFLTGDLFFTAGSVVAPALPPDGHVTFTAPFTFTGHISGFDNVDLAGSALFSTDLAGSGTVRLAFTNNAVGLHASRVTYEFGDPVPEPATITLLGIGLAGAAASRRRKVRGRSA